MLGLIDNLGFGEFLIVGVAALLIFGKRLPEVAAQAGAQIAKFKRSLETMRRDTGIDQEIQKVRSELTNVVPRDVIPRDLSIGEMARMATREIQASLRDVETVDSKVPVAPSTAAPVSAPTAPSTANAAASTPAQNAAQIAPAAPDTTQASTLERTSSTVDAPRDAAGGAL
ncbi:MAG: twin-arginine translocase TatA/TatE family subunit [Planctomycetota bacterium]